MYVVQHSEYKKSVIKSILLIPVFYFLMILESLAEGEDDIIHECTGR